MSYYRSQYDRNVPGKRRVKPTVPVSKRLSLVKGLLMASVMVVSNAVVAAGLEVEPTSRDFGEVLVGDSFIEQAFTFSNTGQNPLQLKFIESVITFTDEFGTEKTARSEDFLITENPCSKTELSSPNGQCRLTMFFKPQSEGTKAAELFVPFDELGTPDTVKVPLNGKGLIIPNIDVEQASYDFGSVGVNHSSLQVIKLGNTGNGPLNLGAITLSGAADLKVIGDFCSIKTELAPSKYCTVITQFEPKSGGDKVATLSISSNDPDAPTLNVPFTGIGVPPLPNIEVKPMSHDFGNVNINSVSPYQNIIISNTGTAPLQLGQISFFLDGVITGGAVLPRPEKEFAIGGDYCSNQKIQPSGRCIIPVRFTPKSLGAKTETLFIDSDDPDASTVGVSLSGTGTEWCSGDYEKGFSVSPNPPNFGIETVGMSRSLYVSINTWARGCGALEIADIKVTGTDAAEFSLSNKYCYRGWSGDKSYSNCQFTTVFSPTSEGVKSAELSVTFKDNSVQTVALPAKAINPPGQPQIDISPSFRDFGTVIMGRLSNSSQQRFTVKNIGNTNLKFNTIGLTGTDVSDFRIGWNQCSYYINSLLPLQQCSIDIQFSPQSAGDKQAKLTITSNDPDVPTINVTLTGTVQGPADCSDANITIETAGSTWDHRWAEQIPVNGQLVYQGPTQAWKRLQNFQGGEEATPNRPRENDVVLIKSGHSITGIPLARVKALCIEPGGTLESLDIPPGTPMEMQITEYLENKGTIRGRNGADESPDETSCTSPAKVGTGNCAYPGASVILKVGTGFGSWGKLGDWWWSGYGAPILNEGQIIAGNGGNGSQYGAPGGNALVLGRNTTNKGEIKAGHGGNVLGTQTGQGGQGGLTQIWGKLGGPGNLFNTNGAKAFAGDGGNCNPNATASQTGGRGGNLWLVSLPNVYLNGGQHRAGKGGNQCAVNGGDGWVRIEPSVIDLSGAHTTVSGGNVAIYGGKEWTLNLSNLSGTVVTATGDITLAVGEGGAIDMRGNVGNILKAEGQVYIFSDIILLDEGISLDDLIEASNIVVGPNKILRETSLVGPSSSVGEPGSVLPINLTLTNSGPEKDTYLLSVTDTAGWSLTSLPSTIEIEGLDSVELALNVALPSSLGEKDVITITAISQADPAVVATTKVEVVSDSSLEPTMVSPPIQPVSTCASSGVIDRFCRGNSDQVLTDITVESGINLGGGSLAGIIDNQGIISQAKVQAGAVVNGGKMTGYIENEGTLADIEFVGVEVLGGILKGNVLNNSKVEGTFRDVSLAADTVVEGGYLAGRIEGDCEAPALLKNLTVKDDTLLSCVILGEGVILGEAVTCGEGVQAEKGLCSEPDDTKPDTLGAITTDSKGQTFSSDAALFTGGISVNRAAFQPVVTQELSDLVEISGDITIVDSEHLGQAAELVVYAAYLPLEAPDGEKPQPIYFMLDENHDIQHWDENPAHLAFFKTLEELEKEVKVEMYQGSFIATGILNISFGYRLLKDGTVVQNAQTLDVTITADESD